MTFIYPTNISNVTGTISANGSLTGALTYGTNKSALQSDTFMFAANFKSNVVNLTLTPEHDMTPIESLKLSMLIQQYANSVASYPNSYGDALVLDLERLNLLRHFRITA